MRNFGDACHHGKEERQLFRLMAERGVPQERGPLGVMLREHEEGQSHVAAMAKALPEAARGEAVAARVLAANARAYVSLPRPHIQKEGNMLYPMAERILDSSDDEQPTQAFEAIERDEISEGAHKRYHQWAHERADRGA